ncbi:VIT1/CCC1 transporter family protein [Sphingomonas abietis]|uniref:VIT1/CCC1 family protein n=1 Tax=Sphingomonas abietis TaxID=3012344 RepID=A0ABY7NV43_9SPHN|nr:VIT1/CCC1 family protein [Sphingomonas abietis]WBO24286.1 VIT1/CCC1 family protein [Sphingomonas abietis]
MTLRAYLRGELASAHVYDALADAESDVGVSGVFRRLAAIERRHAAFWRARLERAGVAAPDTPPTCRMRLLASLARRLGASAVLPILARIEAAESHAYDGEPDAVAAGMPADEYSHARIVQAAAMEVGGLPGRALGMIEGRRRGGSGNALRAAVLGANDGLVSNLNLVMGVAGAMANEGTILLTGLAGLIAGACSMAMGEWLSVSSAREMTQRRLAREATAIGDLPELEKQDLILIYRAKGFDAAAAARLVDKLFQSPDRALDSLAREALGIDPDDLGGSPWTAAAASFGLFALGASFPVAPFLLLNGRFAFTASFLLSGVALIGIGAATSLFTGQKASFSAMRQLAIGIAAAAVTFGLGHLIGVSID